MRWLEQLVLYCALEHHEECDEVASRESKQNA